jgi:hypothetical protein
VTLCAKWPSVCGTVHAVRDCTQGTRPRASSQRSALSVSGKQRFAGTDCGFSQNWNYIRVHPSVQWAKLQALADGAQLATKELWRE